MSSSRTIPGLDERVRARLVALHRGLGAVSPKVAAKVAMRIFLTPPRRRLDPVDAPVLARARRSDVAVGARSVKTYTWGRPQDPAVLMLHGWGSHAARFGSFVDPLLAAGFRAVGIDAPAHGESPGRLSDLDQFQAALEAVLAVSAPIRGAVAHSLGGAAVLRHLAACAGLPGDRAAIQVATIIGVPRDSAYMMESFAIGFELPPRVRVAMADEFERRFGQRAEHYDCRHWARAVTAPTLVVHDSDDEVAPFAHGEALAANLARGEFRATRGFRHSGNLRDPATIAAIVTFLERNGVRS